MLDYFLLQGLVEMNEDGSISKTEICPKGLDFFEEDGKIIFTWTHHGNLEKDTRVYFCYQISDIEEFEHFTNL